MMFDRYELSFVRSPGLPFFECANKQFMEVLMHPDSDQAHKAHVKQLVTGSFKTCGVSLEKPTKKGLVKALKQCKTNAESMMGPPGAKIIKAHHAEMMTLVNKLPDR
jgi:hypothetical protein